MATSAASKPKDTPKPQSTQTPTQDSGWVRVNCKQYAWGKSPETDSSFWYSDRLFFDYSEAEIPDLVRASVALAGAAYQGRATSVQSIMEAMGFS